MDNAVVTSSQATTPQQQQQQPIDENGNIDDDVGSQDSTLDSITSEGTVLERPDVTVSDSSQFIIDPHKTLSVSGAVVDLSYVSLQPCNQCDFAKIRPCTCHTVMVALKHVCSCLHLRWKVFHNISTVDFC